MITPLPVDDKFSELQYLKDRVREIESETKEVELVNGPFHGKKVRIKEYRNCYNTSIPQALAEKFPPLEFDGVPDVPEDLVFTAVYKAASSGSNQFVFQGVVVWKKTEPNKEYPYGYERV